MVSQETREKISRANIGKIPWNKGKKMKGKPMSEETKAKLRISLLGNKNGSANKGRIFSEETRKKMSLTHKSKDLVGEKCRFWKGGITDLSQKIRTSPEYKLWRKAVYERDGYTCIWCKEKNKRIEADHIKPFALFPELRFAIDNGRTLCRDCHKKTDTYGNKTKRI